MSQPAEVIGLDLGTRSAKLAHVVRRRGACTLAGVARADLPADAAGRVRATAALLASRGWQDLPCVATLRGDAVMLRALEVPTSDPRSLRQAVQVELRQFEQLSPAETVSHWRRMPVAGPRRRALLTVARREAVEEALDVPMRAAREIIDLVPAAAALAAAYAHYVPGGAGPVMLIDLSRDNTDLVVVDDGCPLFARSVAIGADRLGTGAGREEERATWLAEIQSALAMYRAQFPAPEQGPALAALCGGAASVEGLREGLADALPIPVRLFEDLLPANDAHEPAFYTAAIGLGLAGLQPGVAPASLLPAPLVERRVLRGQVRYWVLSGIALVLAVLFLAVREDRLADRARRERDAHRDRLTTYRRLSGELDAYSAASRRLAARVTSMESALQNGETLREVVAAVAAAKGRDDWITLIADADSYFSGRLRRDATPRDGTLDRSALRFAQIVMEGYTPAEDLSTVRAMIEALRAHPAVAEADLLGDDRLRDDPERDARWAPTACTLFAIEITVPQP